MNIALQKERQWSLLLLTVTWLLCLGLNSSSAQSESPGDSSVFGVFAGSSPCGEAIRPLLQIPSDAKADLMEWKLTLLQHPKSQVPSSYAMRCDYGQAAQGKPGLGGRVNTLTRQGRWTISKGTKSNPDAIVLELDGAVWLVQVDSNILHVLNRDRSLMIGNGGWSYTLNRAETSEPRVAPSLTASMPEMSYPIAPVATGPSVFGVFEGRSPCQGIARELKLAEHPACMKVKWRVTLYQSPETMAPTTYKVEGSLHRRGPREGTWSMIRGTETDPNAKVYQLDASQTEPALFFLKGDDNVLFFLSQNRKPLVGHAEFSYTLNRRTTEAPTKPGS